MGQTKKNYSIRLVIDSQLEYVRLLGSAVRGIGADLNLPSTQIGQLELMMVEAVNNVIEHAYEHQVGNDVEVNVECNPADSIKMVISDKGHSIPAENISGLKDKRIDFPEPETLPEGGWGLGLISLLADSFHYECDHNGNHLHVCKRLT